MKDDNINNHIIEQELRQTVPRQIKTRAGLWGDIKPFLWILVPHTWIAVAAPFVLVWFFMSYFYPEVTTEGTVTRHYTSVNSKGAKVQHVVYRYAAKGNNYTNDESVSAGLYNKVDNGSSIVPVLATRNPLDGSYVAHIPNGESIMFPFVFFTVWCVVWCTFTGFFVWGCCAPYLRSSHLVRFGTPAVGSITDKRMKKVGRDRPIPMIEYTYEAKTDEGGMRHVERCRNEMRVPKDQYEKIQAGDVVTVLYDEKKPKRSVVYKYADHEACR